MYIEAYFYGNPPECELAAYEFKVIDVPSDIPTLTVGQIKDLLPD